MRSYYEAYKASAVKDILPGYDVHAKTIKSPQAGFPSFYEYLAHLNKHLIIAVNEQRNSDAITLIRQHKEALIALLRDMVSKMSDPLSKGWSYYKFTQNVIIFDRMVVTPLPTHKTYGKPVIFASEMAMVMGDPHGDIIAQKLLEIKADGPCMVKLMEGRRLRKFNLEDMNRETVVDWLGVI